MHNPCFVILLFFSLQFKSRPPGKVDHSQVDYNEYETPLDGQDTPTSDGTIELSSLNHQLLKSTPHHERMVKPCSSSVGRGTPKHAAATFFESENRPQQEKELAEDLYEVPMDATETSLPVRHNGTAMASEYITPIDSERESAVVKNVNNHLPSTDYEIPFDA